MIDSDAILTTFGIVFGLGICILCGFVIGSIIDNIDEKKKEKEEKNKKG